MSISVSTIMRTVNPFTKSSNTVWDAIQDTAKEQWWNPVGWVAKGYDRAGRGASQFVGGTPFGNVEGEFRPGELAKGSGNILLGGLESVGTVAGGGLVGGAGRQLAARSGNLGKLLTRANVAGGQMAAKGLKATPRVVGNTIEAAVNPAVFLNPARYNVGSHMARQVSRLPKWLQTFGARSSFAGSRNAFDQSLSGGIGNFLKNRAALLGSSLLGPVNIFNTLKTNRRIGETEDLFTNSMGTVGRLSTTTAEMLPFLLSRYGFVPGFAHGLTRSTWSEPQHEASNLNAASGGAFDNPFAGNPVHHLISNAFKSQNVPTQAPSALGGTAEQDVLEAMQNYRTGDVGRYYRPGVFEFTSETPVRDLRKLYNSL